jgi:hypothetical protein
MVSRRQKEMWNTWLQDFINLCGAYIHQINSVAAQAELLTSIISSNQSVALAGHWILAFGIDPLRRLQVVRHHDFQSSTRAE